MYCMKPYSSHSSQKLSDSKQIFGYRLSRARRTIENAFGILSNLFRVLCMYLQPTNATKITLACCVLHNILRNHSNNSYSPSGFADVVEEIGNIRWGNGETETIR